MEPPIPAPAARSRTCPAWFRVLLGVLLAAWLFEVVQTIVLGGWIRSLHPEAPRAWAGFLLLLVCLVVGICGWTGIGESPGKAGRPAIRRAVTVGFLLVITITTSLVSARDHFFRDRGLGGADIALLLVGAVGTLAGSFLGWWESRRRGGSTMTA